MSRKQVLLQQVFSAVLFVAVLAMLGWLSNKYKVELDWTAGSRNTLTEASAKLLAALPDPIAFKVFIYPRSEMRQALEADIRRYQRVKPNITVEFIDPSTNPQKVRDYVVATTQAIARVRSSRRPSQPALIRNTSPRAGCRRRWRGRRAGS